MNEIGYTKGHLLNKYLVARVVEIKGSDWVS